jgi:H+/Cl- antiporter ClcA
MADPPTNNRPLRVFDIRNIIGALLGIYGVLLIIAGIAPAILGHHEDPGAAGNRANLYVGTDANWWVGIVLLGVALTFIVWAYVRPALTDNPPED